MSASRVIRYRRFVTPREVGLVVAARACARWRIPLRLAFQTPFLIHDTLGVRLAHSLTQGERVGRKTSTRNSIQGGAMGRTDQRRQNLFTLMKFTGMLRVSGEGRRLLSHRCDDA